MGLQGRRQCWGVCRDCEGRDSSCLQLSVLDPESKKKGYGEQSGARDS